MGTGRAKNVLNNHMSANKTGESVVPAVTKRPLPAESGFTEIRVRGKTVQVPSIFINDHPVVITGKWFKVAAVKDEDLVDGKTFEHPEVFIDGLKRSNLGADLFTFSQKLPDVEPKHPYHLEWDNAAVVPITTYKEWLEKRVEYDVRKAVKKAAKLGVVVRSVEFNDALVQRIVEIYAESPTRQGKAFWHYRKDFDTVKREAGTYLEKSEFIGAYFQDELIGFIKMAHIGRITATIHVIAKNEHFDKKATTALLAKAVEICEQRGSTHLMYGNYIYNDPTSSLTEFKRRNGFEKVLLPRYYVPLTVKGKIALRLGLHRGIAGVLPQPIRKTLVKARRTFGARFQKSVPAGNQSERKADTSAQQQS